MPAVKVFDNFIRGTLTGGHTVGETTLTASGLTALRTITAGNSYCTIIIDPLNAAGNREVVSCTAHGASAGTATISALAQSHDDGEDYVVAFISSDMVPDIHRPWGGDLGLDYYFNREGSTSLPSGWSWVNQSTSTYIENFGVGSIKIPASASSSARAIVHSLSGYPSTWQVTAHLVGLLPQTNYSQVGLLMIESGAKIFDFIGISAAGVAAGEPTYRTQSYTNPTTFNTNVGGGEFFPSHNSMFVRITKNSSTSYDFQLSPDGVQWFDLDMARNPSSYFTSAPTDIGFFVNSSANKVCIGGCKLWTVR